MPRRNPTSPTRTSFWMKLTRRARENFRIGVPVRPDAGDDLVLVGRIQLLLAVGHEVVVERELAGDVEQERE